MKENKSEKQNVKISFFQDIKVTVWKRQYFTISARSEKEVIEKAKNYIDEDVTGDIEPESIEELYETEEYILPSENNDCATIELYRQETKSLIGKNGL